MSSEDNYDESMNYFREKYPVEHELVWMIATKFNDTITDVYSISGSQGSGNRIVKFNVTKASDGSSTISMTDEGAFFLAAVAGAITKNILSFLGSDLI